MAKIGDSLSRSKISNALAGLIIFFSATQLGYHFWPLSSLVYGIRIDYLSPTLYFLDILIIIFLGSRRLLDRRPEQSSSRDAEGGRRLLSGIAPILLVNLLYSQNALATLSWSLHLVLYLAFVVTALPRRLLDRRPEQSSSRDAEGGRRLLTGTLKLALLFQLALAGTQFWLGHSVGGLMYYLGERSVAVGQPSVALATFMDQVVLRPYATFSHPNILAGWFVVSLLIILKITPQKKLFIGNWLLIISTIAAIVGVLLTQSRSALLSLFGLIIPIYFIKSTKLRLLYFLIPILLFPTLLVPPRSDLSLSERRTLQGVSLSVIRSFPFLGAGAQSSISTYPATFTQMNSGPRLLQPDHNSFTLFFSWFGLFGVLAVLSTLRPQFENLRILDLRFLLPLLPLLLLDHYFLTSPQGMFILLLYVQVALNYPHAQKNR